MSSTARIGPGSWPYSAPRTREKRCLCLVDFAAFSDDEDPILVPGSLSCNEKVEDGLQQHTSEFIDLIDLRGRGTVIKQKSDESVIALLECIQQVSIQALQWNRLHTS